MQPKVFTIQEANALIPALTASLEEIFHIHNTVKALATDVNDLMGIWGEEINEKDNPDNKYFLQKKQLRDKAIDVLNAKVSQVQENGCIVKDIESGLVDFYAEKNGGMIFLCWRFGEREIKYWHEVSSSYAGRKPLSTIRM